MPFGLKVVAWSQVYGAAFGTVLVVRLLFSREVSEGPVFPFFGLLVALAFYTSSGAGAILILRGHDRGLRLVRLAQVPQLLHLQAHDFAYTLISGIYAMPFITTADAGLNVGIHSLFTLRLGATGLVTGVGLNLVALGVLLYLSRQDPFRAAERAAFPARAEDMLGPKPPLS